MLRAEVHGIRIYAHGGGVYIGERVTGAGPHCTTDQCVGSVGSTYANVHALVKWLNEKGLQDIGDADKVMDVARSAYDIVLSLGPVPDVPRSHKEPAPGYTTEQEAS